MAKHYLKLKDILQKLLFERKLKVTDLAKKIDIPQPTIHRIAHGKSTRPHISSLQRIAEYFSVTVDQLTGEDPLKTHPKQPINSNIKTIPLLNWHETAPYLDSRNSPTNETIIVSKNIDERAFAITMNDSSMEPIFPTDSILIFDPNIDTTNRNYVLAKINDLDTPIFRQLLIDDNNKYLKPLNPDLETFEMYLLTPKDKILATLIESRKNFMPNTNKGAI